MQDIDAFCPRCCRCSAFGCSSSYRNHSAEAGRLLKPSRSKSAIEVISQAWHLLGRFVMCSFAVPSPLSGFGWQGPCCNMALSVASPPSDSGHGRCSGFPGRGQGPQVHAPVKPKCASSAVFWALLGRSSSSERYRKSSYACFLSFGASATRSIPRQVGQAALGSGKRLLQVFATRKSSDDGVQTSTSGETLNSMEINGVLSEISH